MNYRLKDKELQKRLDDMTDGDLTRQFKKDDWIWLHHEGEERLGIIYYGDTVGDSNVKRYALVFREDEIEEIYK